MDRNLKIIGSCIFFITIDVIKDLLTTPIDDFERSVKGDIFERTVLSFVLKSIVYF